MTLKSNWYSQNKKNIIIAVVFLYFFYIVLGAFDSTLQSQSELYGKKYVQNQFINFLLNNKITSRLNRYTGLEVGYGYFAPNVRAKFFLDIVVDSNVISPRFNSFEGKMKYENQLGEIFSNFYDNDTTSEITILKKKVDNLKIVNIVEYALKTNKIKKFNKIQVFGYCLDNNSLKDYREGLLEKKLILKKIDLK